MSADAGIEPRPVATLALAVRRSTTRLDFPELYIIIRISDETRYLIPLSVPYHNPLSKLYIFFHLKNILKMGLSSFQLSFLLAI